MSGELIQTFPCGDEKCAGTCVPLAKEGRFYYQPDRPWLYIPLPTDLLVPRCNVCNRDWLKAIHQKAVNEALEESYQEHKSLVTVIVDDYRARQRRANGEK